jgi:SAM-dependent methyltransferase
MLVGMVDVPWNEQMAYYRRRAAEYDATAYGDLAGAGDRIAALVELLRPAGDVLEIACGTGMWTGKLLDWAESVTAVDSAPEMIEIARARLPAMGVEFVVADVFGWVPPRRFDTIFFAFWLSHVPGSAFEQFWSLLRSCVVDGGRVIFVDECAPGDAKEIYLAGSSEFVERRLEDGSTHRVVKVFWDPADLEHRVAGLGWRAKVRPSGSDWLVGEASLGS